MPCHNDLLAGNLLACRRTGGEEVRIVDYEYSGNNDPCFELGNIWSEATLPESCSTCSSPPTSAGERPDQVARARLFALMSQYGWTLWASIMDGSSRWTSTSGSGAMQKYERAVATFDGPDLESLLDAAAAGEDRP